MATDGATGALLPGGHCSPAEQPQKLSNAVIKLLQH